MKVIDRRTLLAVVVGLGVAGCAKGGTAAKTLADVDLGVSTVKEGYQNFFAPAGQDKAPYRIDYATLPFDLSLQSINEGTLDLGSNFTDIPLTIWGDHMKDSRIIALIRSDAGARYLGLVARPGLPAKGVSGLRGKRIGYLRSSNYHYYLLKVLKENGMSFGDIVPISLNRDTLPAAFASGQLDAWVTQGVETVIAQRRYGGKLIALADGSYAGNGVVVANLRSIEDPVRAQAIGDYLGRFRKVIDWVGANDDAWATILAKETGIDKASYLEWRRQQKAPARLVAIDDQAIHDQQDAAAVFADAGLIPPGFQAAGHWDRRFAGVLA